MLRNQPNENKIKPDIEVNDTQSKDEQVINFLKLIQESDALTKWDTFSFTIKFMMENEAKYVKFSIKNLEEKYGFSFLDRIFFESFDTEGKKVIHHGTVIGEYKSNGVDQLYIHLDRKNSATAVLECPGKICFKDESGLTQYDSIFTFRRKSLGFSLIINDQFQREKSFAKKKSLSDFFISNNRNAQFINNLHDIVLPELENEKTDTYKYINSNLRRLSISDVRFFTRVLSADKDKLHPCSTIEDFIEYPAKK